MHRQSVAAFITTVVYTIVYHAAETVRHKILNCIATRYFLLSSNVLHGVQSSFCKITTRQCRSL